MSESFPAFLMFLWQRMKRECPTFVGMFCDLRLATLSGPGKTSLGQLNQEQFHLEITLVHVGKDPFPPSG